MGDSGRKCTREDEVQQDGASPVPDAAHGGKVNVQDEEKDAAQETGHAHGDTIVAGVGIVVEDAEQTLAPDVDVALVHDAAEHHYGENLRGREAWAALSPERSHRGVRTAFIPPFCPTNTSQSIPDAKTHFQKGIREI